MRLYQKFLYSTLLVAIFVFYANMKFMEMEDLNYQSLILKNQVIDHESKNIMLKMEIESLQAAIAHMEVKDEKETETMICNYITTHYKRTPPTVAKEISKHIVLASKEKNLAAPLILGIMQVESSFDPYAVSKVDARGLMQVMPEWVGKLKTNLSSKYDLHNISTGIHAGCDVFKIHLDENDGNVNKGLYYYVGKDNAYVLKVYTAVGKYLAYAKANV